MGISPFFRIIFKNTLSHKSRLIGSILGAVIAISFITGSFLTAEAMAIRYFEDNLEEQGYQIRGNRYVTNIPHPPPHEFEDEVMDIDYVEKCGISAQPYMEGRLEDSQGTYINIVGASERGKNILIGEENILFDDGWNVTISSSYAESRSLKVGDPFSVKALSYEYRDPDYPYFEPSVRSSSTFDTSDVIFEFEFRVGDIIEEDSKNRGSYLGYSQGPGKSTGFSTIYLSYDGLIKRISEMGFSDDIFPLQYTAYVVVDPNFLSNRENIIGSVDEIENLEEEIRSVFYRYDYDLSESIIGNEYEEYVIWSYTMKFLFFSLSLPLILLSFYLLLVGARIGIDDKRREIGLLKSKGASKVQVFLMLLFESLFHGLLGGGIGIILGILISKGFIAYTFRGENIGDLFRLDTTIPGVGLFLFALVGIPVLFIALRIIPSFKLSKVPLLETIKRTPQIDGEKKYSGIWDTIVLVSTLSIMVIYSLMNTFPVTNFSMAIVYLILLLLMPLLILFFPFFLILSLTRVIIIGIPKIMEFLSRISHFLVEELQPLIASNLKFNRRKTAVMTLLVATSIAFGTLVGIADGSYKNNIDELVHSSLPTDLMVISSHANDNYGDSISELEGVGDVSFISLDTSITVDKTEHYFDWSPRMYALDPDSYSDKIRIPRNIYLEGGSLESLKDDGEVPNVLINRAFTRKYDIDIGDEFRFNPNRFQYDYYDPYRNDMDINYSLVRVSGLIEYLPGMRSSIEISHGGTGVPEVNVDIGSKTERPAFFINREYLKNLSGQFGIYLVDVNGEDEKVIEQIFSSFDDEGAINIVERDYYREKVMDSSLYLGLKVVLDIEYFYVLVSVIGGLSLMMIVSTASRRREFAEIISRGASRDQILKMILSEGIIILIAGLVVGSGVGILSAFSFEPLISGEFLERIEMTGDGNGYSSEVTINVGSGIIFPPIVLVLHLITIFSVIATSLMTSYLASRVDVSNTLRLRTS